jgi:hypothetical protein
MKKAFVAGVFILGFSGFARAAAYPDTWYQHWFVKGELRFHQSVKRGPGGGNGPGSVNTWNINQSSGNPGSNGNPGGNSFSSGSGSGGGFFSTWLLGGNGGNSGNGGDGGNGGNGGIGGNGGNGGDGGNGGIGGNGGNGPGPGGNIVAPEIDPASGVSALALLSAALLMIRGRRKRPVAGLSAS